MEQFCAVIGLCSFLVQPVQFQQRKATGRTYWSRSGMDFWKNSATFSIYWTNITVCSAVRFFYFSDYNTISLLPRWASALSNNRASLTIAVREAKWETVSVLWNFSGFPPSFLRTERKGSSVWVYIEVDFHRERGGIWKRNRMRQISKQRK